MSGLWGLYCGNIVSYKCLSICFSLLLLQYDFLFPAIYSSILIIDIHRREKERRTKTKLLIYRGHICNKQCIIEHIGLTNTSRNKTNKSLRIFFPTYQPSSRWNASWYWQDGFISMECISLETIFDWACKVMSRIR